MTSPAIFDPDASAWGWHWTRVVDAFKRDKVLNPLKNPGYISNKHRILPIILPIKGCGNPWAESETQLNKSGF